jgi:uncharacterized phiE125 gp8 family phage protein
MGLTLVTAPSTEPITVSEAKLHARVDTSADDTLIGQFITSCRQWMESYLNQTLVTTSWKLTLDGFYDCGYSRNGIILFPRSPLISITSIQYVDTAGTTQTWSSSEYRTDITVLPARLTEAYGYVYPQTREVIASVAITYSAGYGAAASVPEHFKLALKQLVALMYEFREPLITGTISEEVMLVGERLLHMERIGVFG